MDCLKMGEVKKLIFSLLVGCTIVKMKGPSISIVLNCLNCTTEGLVFIMEDRWGTVENGK